MRQSDSVRINGKAFARVVLLLQPRGRISSNEVPRLPNKCGY